MASGIITAFLPVIKNNVNNLDDLSGKELFTIDIKYTGRNDWRATLKQYVFVISHPHPSLHHVEPYEKKSASDISVLAGLF